MKLHGEYLKKLEVYTQSYGMFPAGIHHISEIDDKTTLDVLHSTTECETERVNCKKQLESGIDLGSGYYIRRSPVWSSHRGNSAIQLFMGKVTSILG